MQQMIAPFRADVEPVGLWRPPLPSHRLFAADLADRPAARRAAGNVLILPKAARLAAAETPGAPGARSPAAAAARPAMRRLSRSVLMFWGRARCPG